MMNTKPQCPFECGRFMASHQREGETLVQWWDRDINKDYHERGCAGYRASQEAWSMRVYGIPDIKGAERIKGKVQLTVTLELDASFYSFDKANELLLREVEDMPQRGLPLGVSSGGLEWRIRTAEVTELEIKRKEPSGTRHNRRA